MMRYKASTTLTAATVIPATLLSVLLVVLGKRAGYEADLMYLRIAGILYPDGIIDVLFALSPPLKWRRKSHR